MLPKFPKFKPLSLEDKDYYNDLIVGHPPYSDILFVTLHIWWNLGGELAISSLNNNLVINYHLPFDEVSSGYGLVGSVRIDDSINTILRHLRKQHKTLRLVHVPEFVIEKIANKEDFNILEERDYAEYILDSKLLSDLEGHSYSPARNQIKRFLREVDGKILEIKHLDLSLGNNKKEVMHSITKWESSHPPKNDPERTEHLALERSLNNAKKLDLENLSVFINGELYGIAIFHQPHHQDYYVLHHLRVSYEIPYITDYIYHQLAKHARKNNVSFINIEMDLGKDNLRQHKMKMNPVMFFRKYTVSPASKK